MGPARELDQVSELADRLLERHGIVGRVQASWSVRGYRVTSVPVRLRRAAEERRRVLEALGLPSRVREQPDRSYVLDFGQFDDPAAYQTAKAVRRHGYAAVVVPIRTPSYSLVVGPVSERAALALARTLEGAAVPFSLTRR